MSHESCHIYQWVVSHMKESHLQEPMSRRWQSVVYALLLDESCLTSYWYVRHDSSDIETWDTHTHTHTHSWMSAPWMSEWPSHVSRVVSHISMSRVSQEWRASAGAHVPAAAINVVAWMSRRTPLARAPSQSLWDHVAGGAQQYSRRTRVTILKSQLYSHCM